MTPQTYDLQVVPTDYDRPTFHTFEINTNDTVAVTTINNSFTLRFPSDIPQVFVWEIMGQCVGIAHEKLNELREQQQREQCGF